MSILGFLFVVLAGALTGFSAAGEIRNALYQTEEAIRLVNRLRFFVCVRCQPLPAAMAQLGEEFIWFVSMNGKMEERIREEGFLPFWTASVRVVGLRPIPERILERLGEELSDGEDPERVFTSALTELHSYRDTCLTRTRETGKLYPVVGLSVGCLLGILLL